MAAVLRCPASRLRQDDARRHRQLRDPGDAHRDALEALAEPQPARAGADRERAREIVRLGRARARRAYRRPFPKRSLRGRRYFFALCPPAETATALAAWAKRLEGRPTAA